MKVEKLLSKFIYTFFLYLIVKCTYASLQICADRSGNTDTYSASSQAVYFVGKTRWSVNVEALRTEKVTYSVALTRPGVYNIAPTISVKCLEDGTQKNYDLHSPFILDQL